MPLNREKARKELEGKSYEEIQEDTAYSWGSRALVEADNVISSSSFREKLASWTLALEYYTEATEHAAAGTEGFLKKIKDELEPDMDKAVVELERFFEDKNEEGT